MNRAEILVQAGEMICGDRDKVYGDPAVNFVRIANIWSEILGIGVIAEQVALCMIAAKVSRLVNTPRHEDSWVDIAGYAALAAEVSSR